MLLVAVVLASVLVDARAAASDSKTSHPNQARHGHDSPHAHGSTAAAAAPTAAQGAGDAARSASAEPSGR